VANDNSDYKKPRTNLFEHLPEVYRSDTNKVVFENLFNRFLTKHEMEQVAGYVGKGNPRAITKRQIHEPTVHRQGNQLQPILYNKIGSVEWMSSWYDILNQAERLGIDRARIQQWLDLLKFNWVPPIDLDKFINYRNYYWYDPQDHLSQPQYITIRSRCSTQTALVNFYQRLINEFGETIPTVSALLADDVGSPPHYDKLVVGGDYSRLLEPGFVFFYRESSNEELNRSYWKVEESYFNHELNQTVIRINTNFTDPTVDGVISLQEQLMLAIARRDCQCYGAAGWDMQLWDDNPPDPLWDGEHDTLISAIANYGEPPAPGGSPSSLVDGQQWWDQDTDRLYQFSGEGGEWKVIQNNFSTLLEQTTGEAYWDYREGCGILAVNPSADQWIKENKWLHKSDVPNFTSARQATIPILEFAWDLELNEWTYTSYSWKYRADNVFPWQPTTAAPSLIELIPLSEWTASAGSPSTEITFSEKYGDLTDFFTPGKQFMSDGSLQVFTVVSSVYKAPGVGEPLQTIIVADQDVVGAGVTPGAHHFHPITTSIGDPWVDYHHHWLFAGTTDSVPVNHQPEHPFSVITSDTPILDDTGTYEYTFTYYAQEATILDPVSNLTIILDDSLLGSPPISLSLRQRALINSNNVRVYINGVRQYGTYDEMTEVDLGIGSPGDDQYVAGIQFISGYEPKLYDTVKIEVGEAAISDIGWAAVDVRTVEDDEEFLIQGTYLTSLVTYHKVEQIKTTTNQYPLFDIYNVDGTPTYTASPIFSYVTDTSAPLNSSIGLRLATDTSSTDYIFQQHLVDDDGTMYAYRDYGNHVNDYWMDLENRQLKFWTGLTWSDKTFVGLYYMHSHVGEEEPDNIIDGMFWCDTGICQLKQWDSTSEQWDVIDGHASESDHTLQTIWRHGLKEEKYIAQKRDWILRSEDEYNAEKALFVDNKQLQESLSYAEAETLWLEEQSNHLSESGAWIGDWEIPDPLYYNVSHDNRRQLTFRQLFTHFNTIIQAQEKIPGFVGPMENMFHLIPTNEVNYGVGGTIREYNYGFDTFLSSLFIGLISPRSLYEFAGSQYQSQLTNLKEIFRSRAVEMLSGTGTVDIETLLPNLIQVVIDIHEQNDNSATVYGDSTTFTEVPGANDLGVRNWIATLPYFGVIRPRTPYILVDEKRSIDQVVHHDGHRGSYALSQAAAAGIIRNITYSSRTPEELNTVIRETVLEVESRLYENVPFYFNLTYDFAELREQYPQLYVQLLEQAFLEFTVKNDIETPLNNTDYKMSDPFTWNYKHSTINTYPSSSNVGNESGGDWRDLYQKLYNTPYPHLEPWKLQGFEDKPEWWDAEYLNDDPGTWGNRRWKYDHSTTTGMWENIRVGYIPPQYEDDAPDVIPTYEYFSVNISNGVLGTYEPDDVFPPYWDPSLYGVSSSIRSVFTSFVDMVSPGANYAFGDAGPVEWEWRTSIDYLYSQLSIAFQIDPVRFVFKTFGFDFYEIGKLTVDKRTKRVPSHNATPFHGDIVDDQLIQYNGTNQWYVNFARYSGLDLSLSDFRTKWTGWTTPMTYQFSSFIDTESLEVGHRYVCVSEFDHRVTSKRSPGVEDYWLDCLHTTITNIPPKIVRYDNDYDWEVELRTKSPINRPLRYYDVHNYQFSVDLETNLCSIYTWEVVKYQLSNNTISVGGDQASLFAPFRTLEVVGSVNNDGQYTVVSSSFNPTTNRTIVIVDQPLAGNTTGGTVKLDYRTLPWQTGDQVVLSTRETLPVPLQNDNINGVYKYFVIVESDTTFRLATTYSDAINGNGVNIVSLGRGDHFIGQITSTFKTPRTPTNWRHYAVDTRYLQFLTVPSTIRGLQSVINIVDGYSVYVNEEGWRVNSDNSLFDINQPSRSVGWQIETERFLDYTFSLRRQRDKVPDSYSATVDTLTNVWTFTGSTSHLLTGDQVVVYVSGNVYPTPLARGVRYYIIRDSLLTFRLAATRGDAEDGVAIDITSTAGVGDIFVAPASTIRADKPVFEINPFRTGIWFRPERGIVSNVNVGPIVDAFNSQSLFDQYGRRLGTDVVQVLRQDKETAIRIQEQIPNDIELTSVFQDPYNYIHLSSIHLFVDAYEHVLIFNNYSTEGQMLYDPFIGLNVTKFELLFNRQIDFTQRPNVGGYYYLSDTKSGTNLLRNIEGSVDDMRNLYDTYQVSESNTLVQQSRASMGYEGRRSYLDNLNINSKSQFAFWRGQIQTKGSLSSVKAFINSRRFIDARIDEYWAVKIAEFGSAEEKEYISMWLQSSDALGPDFKVQFSSEDEICNVGYNTNVFDSPCGYDFPVSGDPVLIGEPGFTPISLGTTSRWYEQPNQLRRLRDNGGSLYFDLKPIHVVNLIEESDVVFNDFRLNGDNTIVRHNTKSDFITITFDLYPDGHKWCFRDGSPETCSTIPWGSPVTGSPLVGTIQEIEIDPYVPFTDSIRVFKDGVELTQGVDFVETVVPGQLTSTKVLFVEPIDGTKVEVVYKMGKMVEGLHFNYLTSNIIEIINVSLSGSPVSLHNLTVWGWIIDKEAQNPAKIIDVQTNTVITPVQIWDPARGFHYYNAWTAVNIHRDTDPAIYTNTPREQVNSNFIWNNREVGTTWLDTTDLAYIPYYDQMVFTSADDRSRRWGELADWGHIKLYSWIESDVPPEEWDGLAQQEENDKMIDVSIRKSGRAKSTLFERDVDGNWIELKNKVEVFDVLVDASVSSSPTSFTFELPNTNIKYYELDVITTDGDENTITISGNYSHRIIEGMELELTQTPGSPSNDGVFTVVAVEGGDTSTMITVNEPLFTFEGGTIKFYPRVNIYVNGRLHEQSMLVPVTGLVELYELEPVDRIHVIVPVPVDEDVIEDEIESGLLLREYEYTTVMGYNRFGDERPMYYFWVEDKITSEPSKVSPAEAQRLLRNIPIPYIFFQNPKDQLDVTFDGATWRLPVRFSHVIIKALRNYINDDNRYIIRWTRDFTLRDTLETGYTPLHNKNLHAQWEIFRREQPLHIPRWLWNKVTESIIGYKLDNSLERVPSVERELYDAEYGTGTQYGLGVGQALTDRDSALAIIMAYLLDDTINFAPIDINVFFNSYSFDTDANIITAMDAIYNSFSFSHVNNIFFNVLLEALSFNRKYEGIFKTSMIALHGIKTFQEQGFFDD
jgi:hypothetical protein